jgi:DeoR family deoxyribose operon repressor
VYGGQDGIVDKNARIKSIIETLRYRNAVTIKELTNKLHVSEMTIRRDLSLLEKDNIVNLIPGGAIFKVSRDTERDSEKYLIYHEETRRTREKLRIGQRAASIVEPHDTIILDVGSTMEQIAKFIPEDISVTILCYALNILVEVYRKKGCAPIIAGGYLHDNTLMFESPEGIELIRRTRADKGFISAAGVHETLGITCANPYEVETKKAVLSSSKTKILAVDSTKLGKTKIGYFADINDFDIIITDSELSDEYRSIINASSAELVVV